MILLQCLVHHVVNLVVAEGLLEVGGGGVLVDADVLDAEDFGEVVPVLFGDVVGERAVVCAASENPCTSTNFKVGLRNPQCRCNGEFGQRLGLDALHFLTDEAEAVAEIHNGSFQAGTGLGGEHEAGGLLLADTNAEEVYLELGLVLDSNQRAHLKHVALQAGAAVAGEVEGVVLKEGAADGHALLDDP